MKPFLSNKGLLNDPVIKLCENDKIVSEQSAVSGILKELHVNVARDIGNGLSPDEIETHSSIHALESNFDLNPITNESVKTFIGKSSSKKATGVDGIWAKIIKSCNDTISEPLLTLINFSFWPS